MNRMRIAWIVVLASTVGLPASNGQDLVDAARHRDAGAVRALLAAGAAVDGRQADGATALHWAVYWNDLDTAGVLLDAGADADATNQLGVTPLSLACESGDAGMVQRLIEAGADPAFTPPERPPALLTCARSGAADAVAQLIGQGADVNAREPQRGQTALMWAIAQRHRTVVKVLVDAGADIHARSQIKSRFVNIGDPNDHLNIVVGTVEEGGSTPLLFAARHGDSDSAELLIGAGAAVDDATADGTSALVTATHSGHPDLAALLLAAGANPNDGRAGYTALHAAVLRGDRSLVGTLLAAGADPNARVARGTPVTRGGADFILPQTLVGATPLLLAAKFLEYEILDLLADRGADLELALEDGTPPLLAAAGILSRPGLFDRRDRIAVIREPDEADTLRIVRRLVGLGARVDAVNERGNTALHGAAAHDYHRVIRYLAENGAPSEATNQLGQMPRDVAGTPETARLLGTLRLP